MPLKRWSSAQVVEWAENNLPEVVPFLKKEDCDGATLTCLWEEDFEKYLGGPYGAAFYGLLLGTHDAGLSTGIHTVTDAGLLR